MLITCLLRICNETSHSHWMYEIPVNENSEMKTDFLKDLQRGIERIFLKKNHFEFRRLKLIWWIIEAESWFQFIWLNSDEFQEYVAVVGNFVRKSSRNQLKCIGIWSHKSTGIWCNAVWRIALPNLREKSVQSTRSSKKIFSFTRRKHVIFKTRISLDFFWHLKGKNVFCFCFLSGSKCDALYVCEFLLDKKKNNRLLCSKKADWKMCLHPTSDFSTCAVFKWRQDACERTLNWECWPIQSRDEICPYYPDKNYEMEEERRRWRIILFVDIE